MFAYETKVTRIVDGDTIIVELQGKSEKIRIIGINTPESVDPRRPVECYGKEASTRAKELLYKKTVTLENYQERDRHGRVLGYVRMSDGKDFGEIMISSGYAHSFKSYSHSRLATYNKLEKEARSNQVGLWAPDACLNDDVTQDILHQERITLIKQIIKILETFFRLFFWSWY